MAMLQQADTNGDKQITREEFRKAWLKKGTEVFERMDRNKDGVISQEDRMASRPVPPKKKKDKAEKKARKEHQPKKAD